MIKKLLLIIIAFIILQGCSNNSNNEPENTISGNPERELLNALHDKYETTKTPYNLPEEIFNGMSGLDDEELKKEYGTLLSDVVQKAVTNGTSYELLRKLEKYEDYLDSNVSSDLATKLDELAPLEVKLEKSGYKVEELTNYKGVTIGMFIYDDAIEKLETTQLYKYLPSRNYLVTSNTVIQFENGDVKEIFTIKNKSNQVVNPMAVDELLEIASKEALAEEIEEKQLNEHRDAEQKEKNKISIGMTTDEVIKRLGEPKDINKTTTKYGVSEQWVYYDGVFLYFENGILDTIQE